MSATVIFDNGNHRNILFTGFEEGASVPANQNLVVHGSSAALLDPGGHKTYARLMAEVATKLGTAARLESIFLSHQDPDIVAAVNGWLMTTDAKAYASQLWIRFIPHFGLDGLVADRLLPIPDKGSMIPVGDLQLPALPAHFLHSCGNFQLYDPVSKTLYTGDLGASVGVDYQQVSDFAEHAEKMGGFHRRYMGGKQAMTAWAKMARQLDIEAIVPQHGAYFKGAEMCQDFVDWCDGLECGPDLVLELFQVPTAD